MILLSHPAADIGVHHIARALTRAGVLGEFWTCQNRPKTAVRRVPPNEVGEVADASTVSDCPNGSRSPFGELEAGAAKSTRNGTAASACRSLDREMSARLLQRDFRGVYAFEDSAEESFRAAGRRGLLRIYDLPFGHWRAAQSIVEEEAVMNPEWAGAGCELPPDLPRHAARKDAELEQADLVFVPSSFSMQTLEHAPTLGGTVAVLPHGGPAIGGDTPTGAVAERRAGKLRVLFVGDLSQRMGISYLFAACRELRGAVDLTVVGPRPPGPCAALDRELADVAWLPTATAEQVEAQMAAHDVFVSPTLFDGCGRVMLEAMAMGLPVIATPNSAAPDVIDDGVEGFIVPVRSSDMIVAKLDLLRREPDRRAEMSANARRRARLHTWENYERMLAASVATALACR